MGRADTDYSNNADEDMITDCTDLTDGTLNTNRTNSEGGIGITDLADLTDGKGGGHGKKQEGCQRLITNLLLLAQGQHGTSGVF